MLDRLLHRRRNEGDVVVLFNFQFAIFAFETRLTLSRRLRVSSAHLRTTSLAGDDRVDRELTTTRIAAQLVGHAGGHQNGQALLDLHSGGNHTAGSEAAGAEVGVGREVRAGNAEGARGLTDRAQNAECGAVLQILHGQAFHFGSPGRAVLVGAAHHDVLFVGQIARGQFVPLLVEASQSVDHVVRGRLDCVLVRREPFGGAVGPFEPTAGGAGRKAKQTDGADQSEDSSPRAEDIHGSNLTFEWTIDGCRSQGARSNTIAMKRTYWCDYGPYIYICQ